MKSIQMPPALAAVAQGRDHVKTAEFAHAMSRATQTILKNHCLTGECFGIRPLKSGKLLLLSLSAAVQSFFSRSLKNCCSVLFMGRSLMNSFR